MDFTDQIRDVASRSQTAVTAALTEEATKTSVIMPLIRALGFDVFSLSEVIPEFVADVGTKKGEKVDYALKISGQICMLIEVKPISLNALQFSQLYRYFSVTDARIGILTNGREIQFFSDIDEPNKLDKRPFFCFDLNNFEDKDVSELNKFHKNNFVIDNILSSATNLRYVNAAASYIKSQLNSPDEDFTKLVGRQIHDGMLTKNVIEQLKPAIKSAIDNIVRERIQDRLGVSLRSEAIDQTNSNQAQSEPDIETTKDEQQAFLIVRAISAKFIDLNRITIRDSKVYCSVFVDDNNRRPICRFYFNQKSVRYLGTFDSQKTETKNAINSLTDIYRYSEQIESMVKQYA